MKPGTKVEHIYNPGVVGRVVATGTRKDGKPGLFAGKIQVIWPGAQYHHSKEFIVEAKQYD